jgi:hypothetical protein
MDGSAFALKNVLGPEKLLEKRLLKSQSRKSASTPAPQKLSKSKETNRNRA